MAIHAARWPDDLDQLDPVGRSQSEMKPRVGRRLVAAASDTMTYQATACSDHGDLRPNRVSVGATAFQ